MATPAAVEQPRAELPELASVHWRPRVTNARLARRGRHWPAPTLAHVVPFTGTGVLLLALDLRLIPFALIAWAHAWLVPRAYVSRGVNVVKPRTFRSTPEAEALSVGLLGDLVGHEAREVHARTGLVPERGALGVWLVGPTGALLVRHGGRQVLCWCVRVVDPELPTGDRIAHLLLALREDEAGFATLSNLSFAGARWRVRRRLQPAMRPALDHAAALARA